MRTRTVAPIIVTAALAVTACQGGGEAKPDKPAGTGSSAIKSAIDEAKARTDTKGAALTTAEYEKLMLQLSTCKVTDDGIDYQCEAYKKLRTASNAKTTAKDWAGAMSGLGQKHLGHSHPAVRIKAAGLMRSFFGSGEGTQKTILDAIAKEKHPGVLVAMIDVVASSASKNAEVGKMLLDKMGHESPAVRKKAIYSLSSSWAKDVPGRVDKLIEAMKNDADMGVRKAACEYAGKTGDDKLVPVYKDLTKKEVDKNLYSSCMRGLLETWLSYPFYETTSKAGYELTLKRLEKGPRDDDHPPWIIMSSFEHLENARSDSLKKWMANATWYKKKDLVKVLEDLVKDEKVYWMARTSAVRSLAALMDKADLEKLAKKCEGKCNSHVAKALTDAVAKKK